MIRKNGRRHGEVFTRLDVVSYILDEVGFKSHKNLQDVTLIEPAAGNGIFAIEIIKRLSKSSSKYNFNFIKSLNANICFVELESESLKRLKLSLRKLVKKLGHSPELINEQIFINEDYLSCKIATKFNCIVGNPPYIRHEVISPEKKEYYRKCYSTFKYRADIYIPFYEKSLNLLNEDGKLSFICSNRWLYNQYGQLLRKKISLEFHLFKILNIEKTSPFDESVIAYPCITTIFKESKSDETLYYECNSKSVNLTQVKFIRKQTPINGSWQNLFLDYDINHNDLKGIIEQGFEIGIGVATGADKVFIKKKSEFSGIEKNRLLPLIKSNALKGDSIKWDESYLINPFDNGTLCDLNNYPKLKEYFFNNEEKLRKRHISKKNPDQWYKTIDKVKPELIGKPKLLLPDLASSKYLLIDEGSFYPHHNIYYITHSNIEILKVLACILMSNFIRNQLSQIGIRMNGGLPRLQSQTLKKLRIPLISNLSENDKKNLINAYDYKEIHIFNSIINNYCNQHQLCQKPHNNCIHTDPHLVSDFSVIFKPIIFAN